MCAANDVNECADMGDASPCAEEEDEQTILLVSNPEPATSLPLRI
jgi:hypothetical protein